MAALAAPFARSARAASSSAAVLAAAASSVGAASGSSLPAAGPACTRLRTHQRRNLSSTSTPSAPASSSSRSQLSGSPASRVRRVQTKLKELEAPLRGTRSISTTAPADAEAEAVAPADADPASAVAGASSWHPTSRRVGLITRKIGMTSFFLSTGQHVPATVLQVMSNQISAVIQPKPTAPGAAPYLALQVAAFDVHSKRGIPQPERGHLLKAGITTPKRVLHEFRISPDAVLPPGTELSAVHFVPGQHVDVRAITRGKGFQGAMKRHGFHGLRASHGVSISHRSHGSTGQHQDPGRVFPGKKMAGRMGGTAHRTVQNARVLRIDARDELVLVQGQVPGPEGATVYVTDARRALVDKAAFAFAKGRLRSGALALGNEAAAEYLPDGVDDLPFPAGTKELARSMPEVVEIGPVKRAAAAAA